MSREKLAVYHRRIASQEELLKIKQPGAALLLADCEAFASNSATLPVRGSGNPEFAAMTKGGGTRHWISNKISAASHNKRGLATTGTSTAASIGTSIGVGAAIGGGAAVAVTAVAITGGIALAGLALGIGVVVLVGLYTTSQKGSAHERFRGGAADSYGSSEMMTDLKYLLTNGDLENLARFQQKAIDAGKELDKALLAPLNNCADAASVAYALHRYKWRLRDKLDNSREMAHIETFQLLIDTKIDAASQMCQMLGQVHTANLILHLASSESAVLGREQAISYGKSAPAVEMRDYTELLWASWYSGLTGGPGYVAPPFMQSLIRKVGARLGSGPPSARMKQAFAAILHEARTSSDGDHKNIGGKIADALRDGGITSRIQSEMSDVSTSVGNVGGVGANNFAAAQLQSILLSAGQTAASSASVSSALGASAIGSTANIAGSGGAGLAAGLLVSALVGYALEKENDKRNMKAIFENSVTDPAQRLWMLRSMLMAGRIETIADSYKKCQQSIVALQALYSSGDTINKTQIGSGYATTTHAQMVTATKHLFRMQKHLLRMLALSTVVSKFHQELESQVSQMLDAYLKPDGAADETVRAVVLQVGKHQHNCAGTCYRVTAQSATMVKVANRLPSVPSPKRSPV